MVDGGPGAAAHGDVAGRAGVRGGLEHRRVDDPHEGEGVLVDEPELLGDLVPGRAEQGTGALRLAGGEEDAVAGGRAGLLEQTRLLLLGDVLGDGTGEGPVLLDQHVGEALGAALLGPLLPGVELATGLGAPPAMTTAPT